jgi:hypothetical protein
LAVKMAVLFAGFATGLDVRKFQRFAVGPLSVYFSSRYW